MTNQPSPPTHLSLYAIGLSVIVALCWGGNYTASKFSLEHFPPIFCITLRYALVALVLLPFAFRKRPPLKDMSLLALMMITLQLALVFWAMDAGLSIATTVLVTQLGVPFSCVLGAMFLQDRLGPWRSGGMAIAFIGIAIIAGTPNALDHPLGFALAIGGAISWAASNILTRKLGRTPIMPLLFWTGLLSVPQTLILSLIFESGHWQLMQTAPWPPLLGISYSAFFSTLVGYGLWSWLLGRYPVSQVTPFSLLVPFTGFAGGMIFFGEQLSPRLLLGGAITLLGVAIITLRRPKQVPESASS